MYARVTRGCCPASDLICGGLAWRAPATTSHITNIRPLTPPELVTVPAPPPPPSKGCPPSPEAAHQAIGDTAALPTPTAAAAFPPSEEPMAAMPVCSCAQEAWGEEGGGGVRDLSHHVCLQQALPCLAKCSETHGSCMEAWSTVLLSKCGVRCSRAEHYEHRVQPMSAGSCLVSICSDCRACVAPRLQACPPGATHHEGHCRRPTRNASRAR